MSKDYDLLNKVTQLWGAVQTENLSERDLVTDDEWSTWETFNRSTTQKLDNAIDEYESGDATLSETTRNWLNSLISQVQNATRKNRAELEARASKSKVDALRSNYNGGIR